MPNWVQSKLTITGKDAEKVMQSLIEHDKNSFGGYRFDFNKIKPMPQDLLIVSGSTTDHCVSYYLSKISTSEYAEVMNKLLNRNARWARDQKKLSATEMEKMKDDLIKYSGNSNNDPDNPAFRNEEDIMNYGKKAINNVINYGFVDWYDWCNENWNTKWNACNTSYYPKEDPTTVYFQTAWADVRNLIKELSKKYPENTFEYEFAEEQMGYYCGYAHFKDGKVVESCDFKDYSKEAYDHSFALWGEDENYVFDEETNTYRYVDEDMDGSSGEM